MPMSNAHFLAVACDIHGAELAEGYTGDCIEIAIDESMEIWDGWDALYSVRVYRVSNDEDGNPTHPPPVTVTLISNRSLIWVNSSGWRPIMRPASRPKNSSKLRSLTVIRPAPGLRKTRAVEVLRRPVP